MWLNTSLEPRPARTSCVEVELDVMLAGVAQGEFPPQIEKAVADRVAMVPLVAGSFAELFDHQRFGNIGGVPHAEVDHVHAGPPFTVFQLVDLAEKVWWQTLDAIGHVDAKGRGVGIRFVLHEERLYHNEKVEWAWQDWPGGVTLETTSPP